MIHNRKNVFTVTLDGSKGETPELLMTALAMSIFDLAPALHDDDSGIDHERYNKSDELTADEAAKFIINGREVTMMFPKARMCVAHVFASRLTPTECEIVLTMYDQDGDALMNRAGERMDQLVASQGIDIEVEHDLSSDDLVFDDDEEITQRILALPRSA